MQSEIESIERLCNPNSKVSSHYLINRKGNILSLVNDLNISWHAGKSCWQKYINLNENSIGIELVNKGHQFGYNNFTNIQIFNLIRLCKFLIKKYKIRKNNIIGHSDIAPLRKKDPGEKFPWNELAKSNVGIWHNYKSDFLKKYRKKKVTTKRENNIFFKNLNIIGYRISSKKKGLLSKITKAFQRHFRKELVNGLIDKECLIISKNLSKKI
jgi:N-acetylmuramoyl-L-alanine amidase